MLAACGGSTIVVPTLGDRPDGGATISELPPTRESGGKPLTALARVNSSDHGFGTALQNERPQISDLEIDTETILGSIKLRSGRWRDPNGRDGSRSADEVVDFLRSYLTQFRLEHPNSQEDSVQFVNFGTQKTIRLFGATDEERLLVVSAIKEINTALPYSKRILLGDDAEELSIISDPPAIFLDELQVNFTNGKDDWPSNILDRHSEDYILGIGSSVTSKEGEEDTTIRIVGGYVFIDRVALTDSSVKLRKQIITHEILHAYGLGTHADPEKYTGQSIMTPTTRGFERVPSLYLSIDGEGLLAETLVAPGTALVDITQANLGNWSSTAFHLLGYVDLNDNLLVEFGAGYRNGLAKPWVYGPRPNGSLRNNQNFDEVEMATWNGGVLGFTPTGNTVSGLAEIEVNFSRQSGSANFTDLKRWNAGTHPGGNRLANSGMTWGDGNLSYTVGLNIDEGIDRFQSVFAEDDDDGIVTGSFFGSDHEVAAGILEHPDLSAAFGANLQPTEP